ncbi:hypothetical protein [uncultured Psychroserpens sp.]|uniref:hypothetical protein n=1 Tax=uncultured Psychroserpens sp. TaxID=255436 RepID=UPI00260E7014|nr:hypothetical protein [uncultured Psychroserpens sp.]
MFFDEIEFYTSLPITIPIILLLFFISYKINKYDLATNTLNKLDKDIDKLFFELYKDKNKEISKLNDEYVEAKKQLFYDNNEDYLKELIKIRDEFYKM